MKKIKILDLEGKEKGEIDLPEQFNEPLRIDIIRKCFHIIRNNMRQPYGASPEAGKKTVAWTSKRRRDYKSSYGYGISRTPRKVLTRRGMRFYWVGAFAPNTVGGRRAHPPKSEKIWKKDINKKEKRKAIRSALSALINPTIVKERGHKIPANYPFLVDSAIEGIGKTKEVRSILIKLGFKEELERAEKKKVRAGKGKNRGRPYKKKKSLLIITSDKSTLEKAARNIPGIDVCNVQNINIDLLAPGGMPGRAALITDKAVMKIKEEGLFK